MALVIPVPVQLVISLDEEGKFHVAGPLDNKLLCYGLLDMAREIVQRRPTERILRPDYPPLAPGTPKF